MKYSLSKIRNVFLDFSDEALQLDSWFGVSEEYATSPVEMVCWIDDNFISEWNEEVVFGVDSFLYRYISDFVAVASSESIVIDDPWKAFHSAGWAELRLMAKVIIKLIDKYLSQLAEKAELA